MIDNPLVLTFDIGTQSMRGMLVNKKGEIEAFEQIIYDVPYYSKEMNYAEQRADFYYETLCKISNILSKKHKKELDRIIAITTTNFRDSTLCLDEDNKPLRDLILWLDKREIDSDELPLPKWKKIIFSLAGVKDMVDMQHRQSVCNYIMLREPEIWAKTKKYVVLSTYINYKLTGNLIDSKANQVAHLPYNHKKGRWSSKYDITRCVFDVPNEKLCGLCDPGTNIGSITKKCAKELGLPENIPVIVTGTDKGCETIGLSVTSTNKAAVSFGTSATIDFTNKKYFSPETFCPAYRSPVNGLYNSELQVYRGYWMLSWFINNFVTEKEKKEAKELGLSIEAYFDKTLKDVPAGSDGLILLPHWSPGVANPNARGAIIGWSDIHTKKHLYRTIIEGINFEMLYGLKNLSKRGKQNIKEIYIGGGGSKSEEICQITADILGLPIKRIQTNEACGLGSSMIGFVSLNVYKDIDEAINNMVRTSKIYCPDVKTHDFYLKIYDEIYSSMETKLTPYYKKIRKLLRIK